MKASLKAWSISIIIALVTFVIPSIYAFNEVSLSQRRQKAFENIQALEVKSKSSPVTIDEIRLALKPFSFKTIEGVYEGKHQTTFECTACNDWSVFWTTSPQNIPFLLQYQVTVSATHEDNRVIEMIVQRRYPNAL